VVNFSTKRIGRIVALGLADIGRICVRELHFASSASALDSYTIVWCILITHLKNQRGLCYPLRDLKVTRDSAVEAVPREVVACQDDQGREPFSEWLDTLDPKTEAIVLERIDRVVRGIFGDHASVGGGVSELRIDVGPGYRVYYGLTGKEVHLISGGQKMRQQWDIESAKRFWSEHE